MKKQRRFKGIKMKLPDFVRDARDFIVEKIVALLTILALVLTGVFLINIFLVRSDYFRIRAVEVKDILVDQESTAALSMDLLRSYKGRNIFKTDVNEIARSLKKTYPDARRLTVTRAMPDRLVVNLNFRKPVAILSNVRQYPVDEDGYVLPNVDARFLKDIPLITGISIRNEGRKGKRADLKNLNGALELLKEMRRARFLAEYGIVSIDAGDLKGLSFVLKNGLEVKIGCENIKARLSTLKKTLKDPRILLDRIAYIDLRFNDVVIGPK
ncbi:MAG: cell division protein FtsQ/DivIB [Candidatus Omnitrophota bacterium]